jgi:hypothetical protein
MFLRSGRCVGATPRCQCCHLYYATSNGYCSQCPLNLPHRFHAPIFQTKLNEWVAEQLARTPTHVRFGIQQLFALGARTHRPDLLKQARKLCKIHNMVISSGYAREILLRYGDEENMVASNSVLPLVIDWWNIRQWGTPAQRCYYARYDDSLDEIIKSIPPPLPNSGPED